MNDKRQKQHPACADCRIAINKRACMVAGGVGPKDCPTQDRNGLLAKANTEYQRAEIGAFARQASIQEGAAYANRHQRPYVMQPCKTRIIEICEFAQRMEYARLGLAFCMGLKNEASVVEKILRINAFEVVSVCCKAGCTSKDLINIEEQDKIFQGTDESMCNPIYQAMLLNEQETEFNILLGLCVGHDSIFFKYAQAPTTVLAVKDRLTGHNPLAAIYQYESYYAKIKLPLK